MLPGADHEVGIIIGEHRVKRGRIKRSAGAIDEAFNAIFPGFGAVACAVIEFLEKKGILLESLLLVIPILRIPQGGLWQVI